MMEKTGRTWRDAGRGQRGGLDRSCVRRKRSERTQAAITEKKSTRLYSSSPLLFLPVLGQEEKEGNIGKMEVGWIGVGVDWCGWCGWWIVSGWWIR